MGALASRQNAAVEEADVGLNHQYKYPPKLGNYFGTHFIMGGERFDTPQPEAYLFGENADLNFLGSKPTPFPYPPPQATEPTKTLKSLVNIRKESVRFVKAPDSATKIHGDGGPGNKGTSFNIEFTFDSDARCAITIYYFCVEDIGPNGISYIPRDSSLTSETFHFKRGVNQLFQQSSHIFNPTLFAEDDLTYTPEREAFPVAIHCVVDEGAEESRQSHTTICVIDHHADGGFVLRALKQKIFVDGLCYLLQEIYGIENKNINKSINDEDTDDNGSECVICMCDTRDTLILPCRHLCLCNSCADSLRYQANNCPICRAPFRALLQIRAVQKNSTVATNIISPQSPQDNNDNIPSGYVPVSLIEALNGPPLPCKIQNTTETISEKEESEVLQSADLNKLTNKMDKDTKGSKEKLNQNEFRMSVLLTKEDGSIGVVTKELLNKHSPLMNRAPASRDKNPREKGALRQPQATVPGRDSLKLVNEKTNASNLSEVDDDSEAEKLSPLLTVTENSHSDTNDKSLALQMDGVVDSIDDIDLEEHADAHIQKINKSLENDGTIIGGAEDSDYYTPEDPHTTILSPLCSEKNEIVISKDNLATPLTTLKESSIASLPDSPISGNSHASTRSSGDSYSSSSSTRQLLSSIMTNDTPTHVAANLENIRLDDDITSNHKNTVNV